MNYLKSQMRPVEVFDVQNKQHRALFATFIRTNKWTHSPIRFVSGEPTQVDIGTITRQVIEFYTQKEFGKKESTIS